MSGVSSRKSIVIVGERGETERREAAAAAKAAAATVVVVVVVVVFAAAAAAASAASSSAEERIPANSFPFSLAACLAPTPEMTSSTSKGTAEEEEEEEEEAGFERVQRAKSESAAAVVEAWSGR